MSKYFSATTCSFYDSAIIPETQIPEDKVEITEDRYNELMTLQAQGHVIYAATDGTPATRAQACSPCDCLKHETTEAGTETLGHVNLAASLDDTGAVSVPTAAQVKAGDKVNADAIAALKTYAEASLGDHELRLDANADAITAEAERAQAAEKTNADAIATETTRAKAAEKTNADAIATETTRAKAAEKTNADAITAEASRAKAAEKTNADAITSLTSRVSTNETNIAKKANDSDVVKLTGNQTIAGTKTFSSSPKVPTAATSSNDTTAASTAFVQSAIKTNAYITASYNNGTTWYRKWSDGFIEQGMYVKPGDNVAYNWATPFSDTNYTIVSGTAHTSNAYSVSIYSKTKSSVNIYANTSYDGCYLYACGY